MKIMKGSSRSVIRVGNLAFKFPQYFKLLKMAWRNRKYPGQVRVHLAIFLSGVMANLSEFALSVSCRSKILAPTYFSIGFASIQKFIDGEEISSGEVQTLLLNLPPKTKWELDFTPTHSWQGNNFVITPKGIIMVDYGDSVSGAHFSLSGFIHRHHEDLEKLFSDYKTPLSD